MNAEQIREEYLNKAREAARAGGHDVEVTSLAFAEACARIAELEGARAKADKKLRDSLTETVCRMVRDGTRVYIAGLAEQIVDVVLADIDRATTTQDSELSRLRSLVAHIRSLAPNGTRGLGSIALDVFKAVEEFDRGGSVVDPRDAELARLREFLDAARNALGAETDEGTSVEHAALADALEDYDRAPAAQAEPQAALLAEKQRGIYRKFRVERTDGSSGPGGKHESCEYFVLDWRHDKFAVPAARAYADACSREFPELARDLRATANEVEKLQGSQQDCGDQGFHADGGK